MPADANKPLVVVRGQYTPTSTRRRLSDVQGNMRHNAQDNSGGYGSVDVGVVTVGIERQEILLPPTDGLAWKSLLSYNKNHKGGTPVTSTRQMDEPTISFPSRLELSELAEGKNASNSFETQRRIYNQGVAAILQQFIELAS